MGVVQDVHQLKQSFADGVVLLPGDDGFEDSLQRWSATCVKPAAAVCLPRTVEDVSAMVKHAVLHKIPFNAKGGGHSTSQSSSAPSAEGIVIDLRKVRNVAVDVENRTITFGGGCVWADVDNALAEHGLATTGGTVSHTGVGGLILHGGYGVLAGLHGLSIDNLISCEVVLADGSIVTASETENPDLFWALRGAGSSFGIVTSFTSQAHPQGNCYVGLMVFFPDKLPQLVEFLNHWDETTDGSQVMVVSAGYAPLEEGQEPPPGGRPRVVISIFGHFGANAETEGPTYYKDLLKLEGDALMKNIGMMPYPVVNTLSDKQFAAGKRYLFGGANFELPTTTENIQSVMEHFWSLSPPDRGMGDSMLSFEAIPINAIQKVPVSATAFNSRGSHYNIGFVWTWPDAEMDEEVRRNNRALQDEARKKGYNDAEAKDGVGMYTNYVADRSGAEEVFGGHAKKLRELKAKYDPSNVFDKLWKLAQTAEERYSV